MSVTKEVGEMDRMIGQLAIGGNNAIVVGIGNDAGTVVHNLHPLSLWSENDAGSLKEEGLLLHTTTIGHNDFGMLF